MSSELLKRAVSKLFEPSDWVCYAADPFGTALYWRDEVPANAVYYAINPLRNGRSDSNVTEHRNFLIELDQLEIRHQTRYIQQLGMPYTLKVFSGNKSIHWVISLSQSVTEAEYRRYAARLHELVELADHSTKNPSRFSRIPEMINPKTRLPQSLLECKERVKNEEFVNFLAFPNGWSQLKDLPVESGSQGDVLKLRGYTQRFLHYGAEPGHRTHEVFRCACDMAANGFPLEEAYTKLYTPIAKYVDTNEQKVYSTIRAAYERVLRSIEEARR